MRYLVSTWYDTVTPESASEGDYESTGNDYITNEFADLKEAIEYAEEYVGHIDNSGDLDEFEAAPKGTVVLYAADGIIDYESGSEDRNCAAIEVVV